MKRCEENVNHETLKKCLVCHVHNKALVITMSW